MSEVKSVIRIKTAMERFQDYMKAKGLPKKSSLVHINKISEFEQCERNELREAYEATQAENAKLKDSNAELERLCDVTYVKQGADAYNHCCEVFETWRIKRQKQGLSTHDWADGLYNSLSWLQGTVEELEQKHTAQAKRIAEFERILEGVPEGAFEGGWTARGIMKHAADLVRENKSLRKHCNEQTEFRASQIKMLEQQNKSLIDQLTKVDLLTPRTYVIELPDGAELPNQHIRKEQNEG